MTMPRAIATGRHGWPRLASACLVVVLVGTATAGLAAPLPDAPGCPVFPADHVWHASADQLPVLAQDATWRSSIGLDANMHPDFGAGLFDGGPVGIPYDVVDGDQPRVPVSFLHDDESDPGPYPIPPDASIEGGPDADGDRHVLVVDRDACVLYELFDARPRTDGSGGWDAGSGAVHDLRAHDLRPSGWTSADAAGLAILPGLVRYDEVAAGTIDHPLRFTAPRTRDQFVWPARHQAGRDDASLPPMGAWFRLRADVDISALGPQARVIAEALKVHGMLLADNGSAWFLSGAPDDRWDNDDLRGLRSLTGRDFEAVDASGLMADPDSGRVAGSTPTPEPTPTAQPVRDARRVSGGDRVATAVEVSRWAFPDGATDVVLARADDFADALAATPLAGAVHGPVLLTGRDQLDDRVRDELERLGVTRVWLLGGEKALAPRVASQVPDGVEVRRLSGPNRFATAAAVAGAVAELGGDRGEWVVVALGAHADPERAWPDALGAGVLAARLGAPLLLMTPTSIPPETQVALDGHTGVLVVGGRAAIPDSLFEGLAGGDGREVVRVSGPNRFATAVAAAERANAAAPSRVLLASGRTFADALGAGAAALHLDAALLLVEPTSLTDEARAWIVAHDPGTVVGIGGRKAVADAVLTEASTAQR